jgi:hypothetical protein
MVAAGSVGRPLTGSVRKDESATAVRAYVAGRLEARGDDAYLHEELGVDLNSTAVRRAAGRVQWRPPGYRPPGRQPAPAVDADDGGQVPQSDTAIRDWLAVDADKLELGVSLVTVPVTTGRAQRDVYRALARIVGVVQVLAAGSGRGRRVLAVVLTDGESDRRRVRSLLDELADDWSLDAIDLQTVVPALRTWRHLAQSAARRERLLLHEPPVTDPG